MNIKTYNFDALYDDWLENTPEAKLINKKMNSNPYFSNVPRITIEEEDEWREKYCYYAIQRQWCKEFNTIVTAIGSNANQYIRILATPTLDKYVKDQNLIRALANKKDFRPKYEDPYHFRHIDIPEVA